MSVTRHNQDPSGRLLSLSLAALGIVYGDIGTSPLYALRECFSGSHSVEATEANVLGILSLIFWSLVIIVSIKYLTFVMRADNRGEGGILALMALARPPAAPRHRQALLVGLGLFGAALLYGDGIITPAISVLSAVEGLRIATPLFEPYVLPITIVILVLLFMVQRRGTSGIGAVFGPITFIWFVVLAGLGASWVAREPHVLAAIDPIHGVAFFAQNRWHGFLVLGAVFLVATGSEALYADMGHFGKRPIRLTWFVIVLPALLLNYFGQGALLLHDPAARVNPFYHLSPAWALYPMVLLATVATVIASQAVISGAFSLTRQAVQLGYSPRMEIAHTSSQEIGQIYVPQINWALMLATIGLVLGFKTSSNLAAAYGVAVTTTMVITTLLAYVVARRVWKWRIVLAVGVTATFLVVDLAFFGANILKVEQGGWFPLAVAAIIYLLMSTWKAGRSILAARLREAAIPFDVFWAQITRNPPPRVPGTAVFMVGNPAGTPFPLLHNLRHNKVLHEQVVLLTILTEELPHVADKDRVRIDALGQRFYRVTVHSGFMEDTSVPELLAGIDEAGLKIDLEQTTYFLGRETLIATSRPGMAVWRERLFAFMSRNAVPATAFFRLPPERVVELGVQVEL
ncbi:MAG: potassium transporter Kup [Acidobacteria bacterium]|nr:potassium transporter Kup [Acidobacteriota bacterium]